MAARCLAFCTGRGNSRDRVWPVCIKSCETAGEGVAHFCTGDLCRRVCVVWFGLGTWHVAGQMAGVP